MVICLERGADLHMAQLMPLPLTVSCFSIIQICFTFLVPAHPGSPRQRAIEWVCVCMLCVACLDCTGKRAIKLVVVVVYEKDWADVWIVFLISELRTILITTTEYNTHNCLMALYPGLPG